MDADYRPLRKRRNQNPSHVFRRNVILRTPHCASLWLDGEILNTRITQNLFAEAANPTFGHIFLEINYGPNLIDNNILINSGGNGFYEHDAERIYILQNLIANGDDTGVMINTGNVDRVKPRPALENEHRVYGNIITGFPRYIQFPNRTNHSDMNLFGERNDRFRTAFKADATWGNPGTVMNLSKWNEIGEDQNSKIARMNVFFNPDNLTLRIEAVNMTKLPSFENFAQTVPPITSVVEFLGRQTPQVVSADVLLTHDYFGNKRPVGAIGVGPFIDPPLDGTVIHIDPRRKK